MDPASEAAHEGTETGAGGRTIDRTDGRAYHGGSSWNGSGRKKVGALPPGAGISGDRDKEC